MIDGAGGGDTRAPRAVRVRPGRSLAAGRAASVTAAPPAATAAAAPPSHPASPRAPAAIRAGWQGGRRGRRAGWRSASLASPSPSSPPRSCGSPLPLPRLSVPAREPRGERAQPFLPGQPLSAGQGCRGLPSSGRWAAGITPQPLLRAQPIGGPPSRPAPPPPANQRASAAANRKQQPPPTRARPRARAALVTRRATVGHVGQNGLGKGGPREGLLRRVLSVLPWQRVNQQPQARSVPRPPPGPARLRGESWRPGQRQLRVERVRHVPERRPTRGSGDGGWADRRSPTKGSD